MLLSKLEKVPADNQSMIEVNKKMKIDRSIFADEERVLLTTESSSGDYSTSTNMGLVPSLCLEARRVGSL